MDRSGANNSLLIKANDRLLGQSGLKTGIEHRIGVRVLSFLARATRDRHKHRPIGFVVGVLRAVGGVGVRLLEPWQVSVIPGEGCIHLGVVNRIEISLHFAFADLRLWQPSRLITQVESGICSGIERKSRQWIRSEQFRSAPCGKYEAHDEHYHDASKTSGRSHGRSPGANDTLMCLA